MLLELMYNNKKTWKGSCEILVWEYCKSVVRREPSPKYWLHSVSHQPQHIVWMSLHLTLISHRTFKHCSDHTQCEILLEPFCLYTEDLSLTWSPVTWSYFVPGSASFMPSPTFCLDYHSDLAMWTFSLALLLSAFLYPVNLLQVEPALPILWHIHL